MVVVPPMPGSVPNRSVKICCGSRRGGSGVSLAESSKFAELMGESRPWLLPVAQRTANCRLPCGLRLAMSACKRVAMT